MGSVYGFWKQLNKEEKLAKHRYIQLFYNLQFRRLAKAVPVPTDPSQKPAAQKPVAGTSTAATPTVNGTAVAIKKQPKERRTQSRFNRVVTDLFTPKAKRGTS